MPAILATAAPDPGESFRRIGAVLVSALPNTFRLKRKPSSSSHHLSNPFACPPWCTECMPDVNGDVIELFHQRRVQVGDAVAFLEKFTGPNGDSETTLSIDRVGPNGQLSLAEARQYHAAIGDLIALAESEAGR